MRKFLLPLGSVLVLLMIGCSETPTTTTQTAAKKEPEKAPEPVGGQSGLFRMYQMARSWAPDAQPLKMTSVLLNEVPKVPPGTAPAWEATFVSAAKSQSRVYTFSIIEIQPNLHKGPFAGP